MKNERILKERKIKSNFLWVLLWRTSIIFYYIFIICSSTPIPTKLLLTTMTRERAKLQIRIFLDPEILLLKFYPKDKQAKVWNNIHMRLLLHTVLTISAKDKKQPKCLSILGKLNTLWYIHKVEYYTAVKINRKDLWNDLQDVL